MAETREKNYRGQTLCGGDVSVGDRVVYEDMANPRKVGTVVEVVERGGETPSGLSLPTGREYRVVFDDFEDGETVSDCRQSGWTLLDGEQACAGCGFGTGYASTATRMCDRCTDAAGLPAQERKAHYAAVRLYRALRTDAMANACGATTELIFWSAARSRDLGWTDPKGAPTLVWEGGPYEWAVALTGTEGKSLDSDYRPGAMLVGAPVAEALSKARDDGFYFECVNSFMLAAYRV